MPYDEELAERIRRALAGRDGVVEKKMFGGIAFMVDGGMAVGITRDDLMVRVGPDRHQEALARPHARPMDFTGRAMKGMVFVGPDGYKSEGDLRLWVDWGAQYALSQPARSKASSKRRTR